MLCFSCPTRTPALPPAAVSRAAQQATLQAVPESQAPISGVPPESLAPASLAALSPSPAPGSWVHFSSLYGHVLLFRCRGWSLLSGWEASGQTAAPSQHHPLLNLGCFWPATQSVGVTAPDDCCGFPSGCPQMPAAQLRGPGRRPWADPGGRRPPMYARCATPAGLGGNWGVTEGGRLCALEAVQSLLLCDTRAGR